MMFFQYLAPANLPTATVNKNVLQIQREVILQYILNILLALYTIGFTSIVLFLPQVFRSTHPVVYVIPYLILAMITAIRTLPYLLRAMVLIFSLQALGASALLAYGLSGTGVFFLIGAAVLANILFNQKFGLVFSLLSLAMILGMGFLMVNARIPLPALTPMDVSGNFGQWATAAIVYLFVMLLSMGSLNLVIRGLTTALDNQEVLTHQLEEEQASLEQRVEDRSAELINRVNQFEIASQIARDISGEANLENLFSTAAKLIHDRFGFYHVGIFVNDAANEYAVLRASTGEAGRQMLERNHRLRIGEVGMVGYVVRHNEARITLEVAEDTVHYKNPLLAETRSEMALPLRIGESAIGALDVQSVLADAFSQEDIRILQIIADQLAIAFQKIRLVEDLQRSVNELDATYRAVTQKAWRAHLRNTHQRLAYRYRDAHLENQAEESESAKKALAIGDSVLSPTAIGGETAQSNAALAIPIKLRNQVLGVVEIQFGSTYVSKETIQLMESAVSRLAVSLENARLLEEIQLRAERERVVSDITSKVRAAADVDSVLQIAIQEIGKSLGVSEVMVQLRKEN